MTTEDKAKEIIRQEGNCDGLACHGCPCSDSGCKMPRTKSELERRLKICREYLGISENTIDNPGVCDNAPEEAISADILYFGFSAASAIGRKRYIRELPKTLERKIAEKVAYNHSVVPGSREQLERIALDAIEEYKKQSSEQK